MERIIFVPIERLEERYSNQWYDWFIASMKKYDIDPIIVGDSALRVIETGQFLDAVETCQYKTKQMSQIVDLVAEGFEGKVLFMDGWFPGVEHLAYMRNNAGKKIELIGIMHAGTWDPHDFLFKQGCRSWAMHTERGWAEIYDRIIIATDFHKQLMISNCPLRAEIERKFVRADFPVFRDDGLASNSDRRDVVVFPHRLAPEKDPAFFAEVERVFREKHGNRFADVQFIRTKDVCKTKRDYYRLLSRSKVAFSSAKQETFGIAMLEAVALGCYPVAPDALSYKETLNEWPRYNNIEEAVLLVEKGLREWQPGNEKKMRFYDNADDIIQKVAR